MQRICLFILVTCLFTKTGLAQVTVTNPANTTPNLAATYTSLANAITALSGITAINGPVTITLNTGNPETAPAGGYVIQFAATATAVNNITITGNNNIINAFTPQVSGNLNDAVFKFIGADHVLLQNFVMQENPSNTNSTPGTNSMTEFGVALLRASTTDGAQKNSIVNNTISLNRNYTNTFGIYSSVRHSAANITTDPVTDVTGSNFGNKIYGNQFSDLNYGVVFIGSVTSAYMDNGNDIGGSLPATGNSFTNWGNAAPASGYPNLTGSNYCIFLNHQVNENVSFNSISSAVHTSINTLGGISNNFSAGQPSGTFTSTYTYNTISLSKNAASGSVIGINIRGISPALSTVTININNNLISSIAVTAAGSASSITGITNSSDCGLLNMNNNTIRGCTSTGTTPGAGFLGMENTGVVINNININNNKIGDNVSGAVTFLNSTGGNIYGILNGGSGNAATININDNDINGFSLVSSGEFSAIYNYPFTDNAVNINNNRLGTLTNNLVSFSAIQSSNILAIFNNGQASTPNSALLIQGNDIRGINMSVTGSCYIGFISNNVFNRLVNFMDNTFTNLNVNTTGDVRFLLRNGAMSSNGVFNCNNNRIVGSFNKSGSGGQLIFFYSPSGSVNGSSMTETGNNFSNVSVSGATSVFGWYDLEGASTSNAPAKNISGNTVGNISSGTGAIVGIYTTNGAQTICSSNIITNLSTAGNIVGLWHGSTNGQATHSLSNNTISNLNSTAGNVVGLMGGSGSVPVLQVANNNINTLTSGALSGQIVGIDIIQGPSILVYDNQVNNLQGSGTTNPFAYGIRINGGTGNNAQVYRNNIHDIRQTGAMSGAGPAVIGLNCGNPTNLTAYNNFISDLKANQSGQLDAIRGIQVNALAANSNYNIYHNSVNIDAVSTGTNFGTSGIYHIGHATATTGRLEMINNIIVNTSTANGTGVTAAFRRSNTNFANYVAASNYNLLYAGTPSATRLIYYDGTNINQTLGAFQTTVNPRDANDVSLMPVFVSATDLHLNPANNCAIKGMGTYLSAVNTDIDNDTRMAPDTDLGADEFNSTVYSNLLAGVVGAAVCETKLVSGGGSTYSAQACKRINYILPSGGSPLTGTVRSCVTLDAATPYFNGEPYVQRHYDIEPAINPATATATVTLYFTNQEFIDYNANNLVWPDLPVSPLDPARANVRITQFHGTPTGGLPTSTPGNYTGARLLINPGPTNVIWNVVNGYWEVTFPATGFSGFYVHTTLTNAPLPIIVNYLTGRKQGSNHLLNWKVTCATSPRATMTLERSADSRNFTNLYSITADAARCNQPFDYTDANPLSGMNYYRLKIVDADGKVTYSTTVALLNAVKGFDIISIAPNPVVSDNFKLNVASAQAGKMDFVIFDMQGRLVNRQSITLIAGYNSLPVKVANLASGTYTIKVSMADDQSKVIRFVKQ